jgi:hypothetical protein
MRLKLRSFFYLTFCFAVGMAACNQVAQWRRHLPIPLTWEQTRADWAAWSWLYSGKITKVEMVCYPSISIQVDGRWYICSGEELRRLDRTMYKRVVEWPAQNEK